MPAGRRTEVLELLRASARAMSIVEIARLLDVHVNTVRFHLDALTDSGQIQRVASRAGRPGRPPQLFSAVRAMDPTGPRRFHLLAEVLVERLASGPEPELQAANAGRALGRRLRPAASPGDGQGATEDLIALLADLDFQPERRDTAEHTAIALRHCPFLELAATHAGVVCPIHLGLMQGALEAWHAPIAVDRLDAYVEPDLCIAHLAPSGGPV